MLSFCHPLNHHLHFIYPPLQVLPSTPPSKSVKHQPDLHQYIIYLPPNVDRDLWSGSLFHIRPTKRNPIIICVCTAIPGILFTTISTVAAGFSALHSYLGFRISSEVFTNLTLQTQFQSLPSSYLFYSFSMRIPDSVFRLGRGLRSSFTSNHVFHW